MTPSRNPAYLEGGSKDFLSGTEKKLERGAGAASPFPAVNKATEILSQQKHLKLICMSSACQDEQR